jgi:hypothetical protein
MNNSYRLWNLWDMLKEYGVLVSGLAGHLSTHETKLAADLFEAEIKLFGSVMKARRLKIDDGDVSRINMYLPQVEKFADELELKATRESAKRLRNAIGQADYRKWHLVDDVRDVLYRMHDELRSCQFIFVAPRFAKYYKQIGFFGQEVSDCFSSAIDDIQDAGTAFATGLPTSCVMHLMRVLEVALKTLASRLDIPFAPSWDTYLNKIEKAISAKRDDKTPEWLANEKFYRDVSGDLLTIKQAWRNPTMHVERKYDIEEAEQVMLAVRTFMQRMAKNLPSKEQPMLTLVANNQASGDN